MDIVLAPVGTAPGWILDEIAPALFEVFGRRVATAPPIALPRHGWRSDRAQHLASALVDALADAKQPSWDRLLGVADVDLFAPGLSFVFGEADARRGVAVMSLWRLDAKRERSELVRLARIEAVHELGHTYRLGHCMDPYCAMWFSNTLAESYRKRHHFCRAHAAELASRLGQRRAS